MKRTLTIASLVVAFAAAAGTVAAAIPSATGVISACKSGDGSLKLIDAESGQTCKANQKLIAWNQQGPQGPAGQNGAGGLAGYEIVHGQTALNSTGDKTGWVYCPTGKSVIGGGSGIYGAQVELGQVIVDGVGIVQDHPFGTYAWAARGYEFVPTDTEWKVALWAICADIN